MWVQEVGGAGQVAVGGGTIHCFLVSLEEMASRGFQELVALSTMADSSHLLLSAMGPSSHAGYQQKDRSQTSAAFNRKMHRL